MNRIPSSIRQFIAAFRLLLVFTVICGIACIKIIDLIIMNIPGFR